MENKDRSFKVIAIAALLIGVVGLSIAYAGYTATLTVNGTGTVKSSSDTWNIIWTTLDSGTATGYASATGASLDIDSTSKQAISGTIGTLKAPGDTITYTWKVENKGSIAASLTGVSLGTLSCAPVASGGATQAEANSLCSSLDVAFTYGGNALTASTTGDLAASASKDVTMTVTYKTGTPVTIGGDVTVTIGQTSFTYSQKSTS